jgi:surface antigen
MSESHASTALGKSVSAQSCTISRKPPAAAAGLVILASGLLAGCGSIGFPSAVSRTNAAPVATHETTASIVRAAYTADPSDWETVRAKLSEAFTGAKDGRIVDWSNPTTGSSGTLAPTTTRPTRASSGCREFVATIGDFRGVRRYQGDACRDRTGEWRLLGITPEDATLS